MRTLAAVWALLSVVMMAAHGAHAGPPAASIEYESVARPAGLPADFTAPPGASLEFLALKTLDGTRVDAALWRPGGRAASDTTLVVTVHGSGGNYAGNPSGFLARGLVTRGYAVLGINTRQHDDRVNSDNFLDVRRDLEAAVYTARAFGYRALVLHGQSLGNIQEREAGGHPQHPAAEPRRPRLRRQRPGAGGGGRGLAGRPETVGLHANVASTGPRPSKSARMRSPGAIANWRVKEPVIT